MLKRGILTSVTYSMETKEEKTTLRETSDAFIIRGHLVILSLLPFVRCALVVPSPIFSPLLLIAKERSMSLAPLEIRML